MNTININVHLILHKWFYEPPKLFFLNKLTIGQIVANQLPTYCISKFIPTMCGQGFSSPLNPNFINHQRIKNKTTIKSHLCKLKIFQRYHLKICNKEKHQCSYHTYWWLMTLEYRRVKGWYTNKTHTSNMHVKVPTLWYFTTQLLLKKIPYWFYFIFKNIFKTLVNIKIV